MSTIVYAISNNNNDNNDHCSDECSHRCYIIIITSLRNMWKQWIDEYCAHELSKWIIILYM